MTNPTSPSQPGAADAGREWSVLKVPMSHHIESGIVTFRRSDNLPGNALAQLTKAVNDWHRAQPSAASIALTDSCADDTAMWPLKTTPEELEPGDGTIARWKKVGDLLDDARQAHALKAALTAATRALDAAKELVSKWRSPNGPYSVGTCADELESAIAAK